MIEDKCDKFMTFDGFWGTLFREEMHFIVSASPSNGLHLKLGMANSHIINNLQPVY